MLSDLRLIFIIWLLLTTSAFAMKGGAVTERAPGTFSPTFPSAIGYRIVSNGAGGWIRTCSGCRISPHSFLTAGHCTDGIDPTTAVVEILTAGGDSIRGLKFKRIANAPNYRVGCQLAGTCRDASTFQLVLSPEQQRRINQTIAVARTAPLAPVAGEEITITGAGCEDPQASLGRITCRAKYSFDQGRLKYYRTRVQGQGTVSGRGGTAYIHTVMSRTILGPGDSGGCAYDRQDQVTGTNSQSGIDPEGTGQSYLSRHEPQDILGS